jgi:preprotein translocase subunit SecB
MIADLQLDNFLVDELTCRIDANQKKPAEKFLFAFDFDIKSHNADPNKLLVSLEVDLNKGRAFKTHGGYQIHLHMLGWFSFGEGIDKDTKTRMAYTNATSILYGVARGIVAQITGGLGRDRVLLPAVNMQEIAKQKAQKKQKSSEEQDIKVQLAQDNPQALNFK